MAAIEISGLTKEYGDVVGVADLSLSVRDGEVFGYLGPNGAGKTTTIRTLLGFQRPTAGTATVLGRDVRDERELIEAKRRIGYLPAHPAFDEGSTGREILDLHGAIKGEQRREELLALFEPPLDRPVREYSTGNVQKLGLVQAFMHDPDLVVLDEPTSGLDPLLQRRFEEFVREERARGTTVFFSSHVLSEVRQVCDRVGILRNGRLVAIEDVDALLTRSGKHVRLQLADAVDPEILTAPDVHDVTVSSRAAPGAETADRPTDGDDRREAVTSDGTSGAAGDAAAEDDGWSWGLQLSDDAEGTAAVSGSTAAEQLLTASVPTEVTFTYTGEIDALLDRLADLELLDCTIEEAPLEEVFMRFYDDDPDGAAAPGGDGDV